MSKTLLRRLVPWSGVSAALLIGACFAGGSLPLWGRLFLTLGAALVGLARTAFAVRRHVAAPLSRMTEVVSGMRGERGPLPTGLEIHRTDELGALAREVALLAGERNASDLRREENDS